jgi:hypothetical protein
MGNTVFVNFKVAMTSEKFPEKIPFRLTRMLTNAMEVRPIKNLANLWAGGRRQATLHAMLYTVSATLV